MQYVDLANLTKSLNELLRVQDYSDFAFNGLQVESGKTRIGRIAFAVDCGMSIIEKAVNEKADLLIVHHGLLWGNESRPITGIFGEKIRLLIKKQCSLYAAHLPLDGHPVHGNGACLARFLGLENIVPYFEYKGMPIGARGNFPRPLSLEKIVEKAAAITGAIDPFLLPFGKKEVKNVGIVTGSGSEVISSCKTSGIDLLISGESKQSAYHEAKEYEINALFVGHYGSETFGVRSLQQKLEKEHNISTVFIDEPTGI